MHREESMKITNIRVLRLTGPMREGLAIYEIPRGGLDPYQSNPYQYSFTQIETDEGASGLSLGGSPEVKSAGEQLVGLDPLCYEAIWERLYTSSYTRFAQLRAVSSLDVALWDLIGHARQESVHRLLGGPCQTKIRAYAGMLGFSTEPHAAAERSIEWVEKGFGGLKWYLPYNADAGDDGLRHNVALIKAVREAVGDDVDIMIDWLLSDPTKNSLLYAIKLARRLESYHPTWIEEPLNFDDLNAHVRLARETRIPLAFGEHWYTRWQFKQLLDSGAPTVIQPETLAVGGLSEMRKIAVLASTYGVAIIPHANESCRMAIHLSFSQPARTCPWAEWGVKINYNAQFFYQDFYEPIDGFFPQPQGHGMGYALDLDKAVEVEGRGDALPQHSEREAHASHHRF